MSTDQATVPLRGSQRRMALDMIRHKYSTSRRLFWTIFAAVWLQVVVITFIAVQLSRLNTPVSSWMSKTFDLLFK